MLHRIVVNCKCVYHYDVVYFETEKGVIAEIFYFVLKDYYQRNINLIKMLGTKGIIKTCKWFKNVVM